ncbi:MAG TPA: hypothetical protein VGD46_16175 [Rhizobacter sp.]
MTTLNATALPTTTRLRRTFDHLLIVLNLLAMVTLSLLASRLRFEVVLATTAGLLLLDGASLLYHGLRPTPKVAQSPLLVRRIMVVVAAYLLYEGLATCGVVAVQAGTHNAVAAYERQRQQDLAVTMDCERKANRCWQEAVRGAGSAFGLGLMVTMGPHDAFDPVTRRALLLRAASMASAESSGAAMSGLRAIDRACARSLLCSLSLGRSAARDAVYMRQTMSVIDLLAQRTREP